MARRRPRDHALVIGLGLLVAACSSSEPELPPACPNTLFLGGAEKTVAYGPGGRRSPDRLRHIAVLTNLASGCRYAEAGVDVGLAFDVIAERGPAFAEDPLRLTYFVVTLGPRQEIRSKQLFDVEIAFEARDTAGSHQELTLRIPLSEPDEGAEYSLYVGFQLDDVEMQERLDERLW